MRHIKNLLIILCGTFIIAGLSSCEEDSSFGNDINEDYRDKYIGNWTCTETPAKGIELTYTVKISKDTANSSRVYLKNFGFSGLNEKAAYGIVTENSITVPEQTICNDDSWVVEGIGYLIKSDKMTWEYSINDGADLSNYTAVFIKQ